MGDPIRDNYGPATANSSEERAAASRYVLRVAHSREDLRLLLDALGLNTTAPKEC